MMGRYIDGTDIKVDAVEYNVEYHMYAIKVSRIIENQKVGLSFFVSGDCLDNDMNILGYVRQRIIDVFLSESEAE